MVNEKINTILVFLLVRTLLALVARSPGPLSYGRVLTALFFSRKSKDSELPEYYASTYCLLSKGKATVQPNTNLIRSA